MKKPTLMEQFLSTEQSEWQDLCIGFATIIADGSAEAADRTIESFDFIEEIAEEQELELDALIGAFREFYHACAIAVIVTESYKLTVKGYHSMLDRLSLDLLEDYAGRYDYELQDDLVTIFIDTYNIFSQAEDSEHNRPIHSINSVLLELYNNNAEREADKDTLILDIFSAPIVMNNLSHLMQIWLFALDLRKIAFLAKR